MPKPVNGSWLKRYGMDAGAAFVLLAACVYAALKPIWDWDIIPYVALAMHLQGLDWSGAHAGVYGWVATLPEVWRDDLMSREFYRAAVAADGESLRQVSVFYQARIGYYGLLAGLNGVGLTMDMAVHLLNLIGQLVLGVTLWLWVRPFATGTPWRMAGWLVFFTFLMFNPTVMKLARWSSPDGLVAALYVLGVYGAIIQKHRWWTLAWLAMVLLRPNTALWLMPLLVWAGFQARACVIPLAIATGTGLMLQTLLPNYPLAVLWQHTFGFPYAYPAGVRLEWGWDVYQTTWWNRISHLHGRDLIVWGTMVGSVAWVWFRQSPHLLLAIAVVVGGCLQLLMFPAFWERYFAGLCLVVLMLAVTVPPCRTPAR